MKKQLRSRQWARHTYHFHSVKTGRREWCESLLERDYLLHLEFDDTVDSYRAQPQSFSWNLPDKPKRRYTPDVLINRGGRLEFVEVKPEALLTPELRETLAWKAAAVHRQTSVPLVIVTDTQFRHGHTIENLRRLYGYKRSDLDEAEVLALLKSLPRTLSLEELKAAVIGSVLGGHTPLALLALGYFRFDRELPLEPTTLLEKTS